MARPTAGPPDAKVNSEGFRTYRWPTPQGEVELLSVTSIRKLVGEPFGLVAWQIGKVVDRALSDDYLAQRLAEDFDPLRGKKYLKAATTEERDAAASKGIDVHGALELGFTLDQCNDVTRPYVAQVHDFLAQTGFEIVRQEFQVFNLSAGYAGTADVMFRKPNGAYTLGDFKTSKNVYVDHLIQLHAYLAGEFVGAHGVKDDAFTEILHSTNEAGVLHLTGREPHDWTWYEIPFSQDVLRAFLGSVAFARLLAAHKTPDGLFSGRVKGVAK